MNIKGWFNWVWKALAKSAAGEIVLDLADIAKNRSVEEIKVACEKYGVEYESVAARLTSGNWRDAGLALKDIAVAYLSVRYPTIPVEWIADTIQAAYESVKASRSK